MAEEECRLHGAEPPLRETTLRCATRQSQHDRRLMALPPANPPEAKVFRLLFFKKVTPYFRLRELVKKKFISTRRHQRW
jgi:hypothetical protein